MTDRPSARPLAPMIGALWLAEAATAFVAVIIYAAVKALIVLYKDPVLVGWLVTSFLLAGAVSAAIAGRLGDIYGRKSMTLVLLACGFAGLVLSAVATEYWMMLLGRLLQGLLGAVIPLSVGLVRENVRGEKMSLMIGVVLSGAAAGAGIGLVTAGWLVDQVSVASVFWAAALLVAASLAAVWLTLPPSLRPERPERLDVTGGVLFGVAVVGLLLFITNGGKTGWAAPSTLALLGGTAVALALWVRSSLTVRDPLINIRLFADRRVWSANLVTALASIGTLQITLVFSLLLQAPSWTGVGLGLSATLAGLTKLPSNVTSLLGGPVSGWVQGRFGGRVTLLFGASLCTVGWVVGLLSHGSVAVVVAVLCVISLGTMVLFVAAPAILAEAVPADRTSEAVGVMAVIRQTFSAVGAQLVTVLLASSTIAQPGDAARYPTEAAFVLTMAVMIGIGVLTMAACLALPRRLATPRPEERELTPARAA